MNKMHNQGVNHKQNKPVLSKGLLPLTPPLNKKLIFDTDFILYLHGKYLTVLNLDYEPSCVYILQCMHKQKSCLITFCVIVDFWEI